MSIRESHYLLQATNREVPQRSYFYGVYHGLVEDNKDPLRIGRLKVRLPIWFDVDLTPTDSLPWVFPSTPSGGNAQFGFYFVPPVGSQVVVAFVDGDPRFPIWMGTTWGAPGGIPDTFVSSFDDDDPYGTGSDPALWDYTQQNSLTSPGGHQLIFDDNAVVDESRGLAEAVNFRRIILQTPGAVELTVSSASGFRVGERIYGNQSGSSGVVIEAGVVLKLHFVRGSFTIGETVAPLREGGPQATISAINVANGLFLRMVEDKDTARTPLATEQFKAELAIGTPDSRLFVMDDHDETVRLETPDGHRMEFNSFDDYVRMETEYGSSLVFDDPTKTVVLSTPGGDPANAERGFMLSFDEPGRLALLKGTDRLFYFTLDESRRRIGMYSTYPLGQHAGVEVARLYVGGSPSDAVTMYANDGRGTSANGILIDPGNAAIGRPRAVSLFSNSRTSPSSIIRLVTEGFAGEVAGQIDIGDYLSSRVRITLRPDPIGSSSIEMFAVPGFINMTALNITMMASNSVYLGGPNTTTGVDGIAFGSPWGQRHRYYNHRHELLLHGATTPITTYPFALTNALYVIDPVSGVLPVWQGLPLYAFSVSNTHN